MKVIKLSIPSLNASEGFIKISFFKAVVMIHQCNTYSELDNAANEIYMASGSIDPTDFAQLKTMISNHRNRIERNTR